MGTLLGVDAMGFHTPAFKVTMVDLAAWRGVDPAKYRVGLGIEAMSVCPPDEDTVTMAASAAKLALRHLDGRRVGLVMVGTETGIDHSKPCAVVVHRLLGLDRRCRTLDTQHACYGVTGAIQLAVGWVSRSAREDEVALVIASDVSLYDFKSAGEPTQGAGAVAFLLSRCPRVLAIHPTTGAYTEDVMDFWRPLGRPAPLVDGKYSLQCYMNAVTGAYADLFDRLGERFDPLGRCDALLYHNPFGKMAVKAHCALLESAYGWDPEREAGRIARSTEDYVRPGLTWGAQVGNIYTGSLYLALLSLIDHLGPDHPEQTVGFASYGSGCMAESFLGTLRPDAHRYAGISEGARVIEQRQTLDLDRYEAWIEQLLSANGSAHKPEPPHPAPPERAPFVYCGTNGSIRSYQPATY